MAQSSCITTASAPGGTGAPVKILAALPGSSCTPIDPAGIRWAIVRVCPEVAVSAQRTA